MIYSLFILIQVALYMLILSLGVKFPAQGLYMPGYLELFITLFLTMLAGITFGLIVSAVSRSTEMAIYSSDDAYILPVLFCWHGL